MNYEKIIRWTARVLLMAAILFMMMFSLDVFDSEGTIGSKLPGLVMHNIPSLVLLGILILAWKHEMVGGVLQILAALVMMFYFHSFTTNKGSLIIMLPFLVAGVLFILSDRMHCRKTEVK